jgi:hypothetical protein
MNNTRPTLPTLTVNCRFMLDFIAEQAPCIGFGWSKWQGANDETSQAGETIAHNHTRFPSEIPLPGGRFPQRGDDKQLCRLLRHQSHVFADG